MKLILIGNPGSETIYNPNHIIRVSKALSNGKPYMKILTVAGNTDTVAYNDEDEYQKNLAVLKGVMLET